jgi:hypothetical protein
MPQEELKQMIDAILDKNDEAAETAFHKYATAKVKAHVHQMINPNGEPVTDPAAATEEPPVVTDPPAATVDEPAPTVDPTNVED